MCALWRLLSCCFCLFFEGADELGWGIIANLCASFVLLFKNVYALYSSTLCFYIGGLKSTLQHFLSSHLAAVLEFVSCLTANETRPKEVLYLFISTSNTLISLGETPGIREACANVSGLMRANFCRPSVEISCSSS